MNDERNDRRTRQWRALLPRLWLLAATVAAATVLITACGGGGSSTAGTSNNQKALAFAQCMRSHGEPNFPDPTSNGTFSISQINITGPAYHSALSACHQLRAGVQIQLSAKQQQELINQYLRLAACMRSHGLPDFPDPNVQDAKAGYVMFSIPSRVVRSPLFQSAQRACESQ